MENEKKKWKREMGIKIEEMENYISNIKPVNKTQKE